MNRRIRITLISAALALGTGLVVFRLVGCTTASLFDTGSKPANPSASPTSAPANAELLAGNWVGQWKSTSADRGGQLEAVITPRPDGDYDAKFRAQVIGPLKVDQEVVFKIASRGDVWTFAGKKDLGVLKGGVYSYTGTTDGRTFTCTYDSSFDKGKFELTSAPATTAPAGQ